MKYIFIYTMELDAESEQEAWDCLQERLENDSDTQLDVLDSSGWFMDDPADYEI